MRTILVLFVIQAFSCKIAAGNMFSSLMDSIVGNVESAVNEATADLMSRHLYQEDNFDVENAAEEVDGTEDTNYAIDTNTAVEEQNIASTTAKIDLTTSAVKSDNAVTPNAVINNGTGTKVNKDTVTEISTVNNVTDINAPTEAVTSLKDKHSNDSKEPDKIKIIREYILIDGPVPRTPRNKIEVTTEKTVTDNPINNHKNISETTPKGISNDISTEQSVTNDGNVVTDNPAATKSNVISETIVTTTPNNNVNAVSTKDLLANDKNNHKTTDENIVAATTNSTVETSTAKYEQTTAATLENPVIASKLDQNDLELTTESTDVTTTAKNEQTTAATLVNPVIASKVDQNDTKHPTKRIRVKEYALIDGPVPRTPRNKIEVTTEKTVTDNPINNDKNMYVTTPKNIDNNKPTEQSVTNDGNTVTDNPTVTNSNDITETIVTTTLDDNTIAVSTEDPLGYDKNTNKITDENVVVATTDSTVGTSTAKNQETTTATLENPVIASKIDQNDVAVTTEGTVDTTTAKDEYATIAALDDAVIGPKIDQNDVAITTESTAVTTTAKNEDATTLSDNINDFKSTTIPAALDNTVTSLKGDQINTPVTIDGAVVTTTPKNEETTVTGLDKILTNSKIDLDYIALTTESTDVTAIANNEQTTIASLDDAVLGPKIDQNDVAVTTEGTVVTTTAKNEQTTTLASDDGIIGPKIVQNDSKHPTKRIRVNEYALIDGPVPRTPRNKIEVSTEKTVTDNPINNDTTIDKDIFVITPKGIDNDITTEQSVTNDGNSVTDNPAAIKSKDITETIVTTTPDYNTNAVAIEDLLDNPVTSSKVDQNDISATRESTAVTTAAKNNEMTAVTLDDVLTTPKPDQNDIPVITDSTVTTTAKNKDNTTSSDGIKDLESPTTANVDQINTPVTIDGAVVTTTPKTEDTTVSGVDNILVIAKIDQKTTTEASKIDQNDVTVTPDNFIVITTAKIEDATTTSSNIDYFKSTTVASTSVDGVTTSKASADDVPFTTESLVATMTAKDEETTVSGFDNIPTNSKIDQNNIAVATDTTVVSTTAKNEDITTSSDNINDFKSTTIPAPLNNAVTKPNVDQNDIPVTTESTLLTTSAKTEQVTAATLAKDLTTAKIDQYDVPFTTDSTNVTTKARDQETIPKIDQSNMAVTTESTVFTSTAKNEQTTAATLENAVIASKIDQNYLAVTPGDTIDTTTAKNEDATTSTDNINDFKSTTIPATLDNTMTSSVVDQNNIADTIESTIATTAAETEKLIAADLGNDVTTLKIYQQNLATATASTADTTTAENQDTTTANYNTRNVIELTTTSPLVNVVKTPKIYKYNIAVTTQGQTTNMSPLKQHIRTFTIPNDSFTTNSPAVSKKYTNLDKSTDNTQSNYLANTSDLQSTTITVDKNGISTKRDATTDQNTVSVTTSGPVDLITPKDDPTTNTRRIFMDNTALDKFNLDSTTPSTTNDVTTPLTTIPERYQQPTTIDYDLTTKYPTTIGLPKDGITTLTPKIHSTSAFDNKFDQDSNTNIKNDLPTTTQQQIDIIDTTTHSYVADDVYMGHPTIGLDDITPTIATPTTKAYPTTGVEAEKEKEFIKMFNDNIIPILTTTEANPTTTSTTSNNSIPQPMFVFGGDLNGEPETIIERDDTSEPVIMPISNNSFEIRYPNPTTTNNEIDTTKRYNPKILLGRDFSEPTTPSTMSTTDPTISTTTKKPTDYNFNILIKYLKPKRLNDNHV